MTQRQLLNLQANQILREDGCRWDGRKLATDPKLIEAAKAQAAYERAMPVCPFSGRSKRK